MMGNDSDCGIENVDCIASDSGSAYTGTVSKTKAGVECQAWNDQSPHHHDVGTEMEHNHCRNPDGKPGLWCYTKDSNTTWDFCEVKKCRDCKSDLDFDDSDGEKDIVKLKGRCTVKKTAKTVLTGIKTKAECLTECLANEAATGCQYRRVKKICKLVTASFEKASYRPGVTCWRFDDTLEVRVFPNMTNTRIPGLYGEQCGLPGWYCPSIANLCCLAQGEQGCCSTDYPKCGELYCHSGVHMAPHPNFLYKHFYKGHHTEEEVEEFCKRRNKNPNKCNRNHVFTGKLINVMPLDKKNGLQIINGDQWYCTKINRVWSCTRQKEDETLAPVFGTIDGHFDRDSCKI